MCCGGSSVPWGVFSGHVTQCMHLHSWTWRRRLSVFFCCWTTAVHVARSPLKTPLHFFFKYFELLIFFFYKLVSYIFCWYYFPTLQFNRSYSDWWCWMKIHSRYLLPERSVTRVYIIYVLKVSIALFISSLFLVHGCRGLEPIPAEERQGTPRTGCQLITGLTLKSPFIAVKYNVNSVF